eukprot:TRINITY_DN61711_c0_g1_i1.p1 TRINITY_DN61711_c0_g1~~TRINITY_DN61711_c0_g1_i1.p1  ORF type:complete len:370 (+),score=56.38 TRINITY_DN61711_c0_g1_i1:131-1111(+)
MTLDRLADSVAPAICGQRLAKKGLILMLLGGVSKPREKSGNNYDKLRGNIHLCLHGGPETAKSTLLRWVTSMSPRNVYISGASASAAGLTAAVQPETATLAPGALIQTSDAVCCIDQFELLEESARNAVREVMDQQSISFSKAGLQTTLKARTSVLAACTAARAIATPSSYRMKRNRTDHVGTELSSHQLGGFDLVLDMDADEPDEKTARHILLLASGQPAQAELSLSELQRYIMHAKRLQPVISADASDRLTNYFVELRRRHGKAANPRHLESLIRLSEATARACMQEEVSVEHVNIARGIVESSLDMVALISSKRGRHEGPWRI